MTPIEQFEALPNLSVLINKIIVHKNGFHPTLTKTINDEYIVNWCKYVGIPLFIGETATEAISRAYDWCVEHKYIIEK